MNETSLLEAAEVAFQAILVNLSLAEKAGHSGGYLSLAQAAAEGALHKLALAKADQPPKPGYAPILDRKLQTLVDGGSAIVDDEWMDQVLADHPEFGLTIRTVRNKRRLGIHDQYVAYIHDSGKPSDLEYRDIRGEILAFGTRKESAV